MKRFSFRLARVERLRRTEKRASAARLAQALAEAATAAERVELSARIEGCAEARWSDLGSGEQEWGHSGPDPGIPVPVLICHERALELERARADRAAARRVEIQIQTVLDARRREHVEYARAHRVLERLHERQRERWSQTAEREEQGQLDEQHRLLRRESNGSPGEEESK